MMIEKDKDLKYDDSPCDVGETRTNSSDVKPTNLKEPFMVNYVYGVHCGRENCYSCGTQRYACSELNVIDNDVEIEAGTRGVTIETVLSERGVE